MVNLPFKFKTLLWCVLAVSPALSATNCCLSQPVLEAKIGYYLFSDSKMRQIYDKGGVDIQLCGSYPLWDLTSRWSVDGYGALEYFYASGHSTNGNQKTSLCSVPINLGLRPVYAIDAHRQFYFALGPRYFYVQQHNQSPFIYKNRSRSGLGFFINTGFNYLMGDHLVLDLFGEYSYAKTRLHGKNPSIYTRNIQIGGFTFGGGIGYSF